MGGELDAHKVDRAVSVNCAVFEVGPVAVASTEAERVARALALAPVDTDATAVALVGALSDAKPLAVLAEETDADAK